MTEVTISADREEIIYSDGYGTAHVLTNPLWNSALLGYVERRVLVARLRAVADLIEEASA